MATEMATKLKNPYKSVVYKGFCEPYGTKFEPFIRRFETFS